jgi:prepilin-type N-terminal cleavage/methylation domain-containing protein
MKVLRSHGVTLVELLLVIAVLGIAAVVAIPEFFSSRNPHALELAAEEVANAIRFARSEAIRLDSPRGFQQQTSEKRIRVFRAETGTSPWTLSYDVYHPLSKQLYDVALGNHPFAAADTLDSISVFQGTCNQAGNIYFDNHGTPWCTDPKTVPLQQLDITLTLGTISKVVTLDGITGRVTIQ